MHYCYLEITLYWQRSSRQYRSKHMYSRQYRSKHMSNRQYRSNHMSSRQYRSNHMQSRQYRSNHMQSRQYRTNHLSSRHYRSNHLSRSSVSKQQSLPSDVCIHVFEHLRIGIEGQTGVAPVSRIYCNPIAGLDRPWVFQEVEAPRFQDNWHMKVVRLWALRTGVLHPPGNIPGTHFCLRMSQPQCPRKDCVNEKFQ
jgi:hypothetical protein